METIGLSRRSVSGTDEDRGQMKRVAALSRDLSNARQRNTKVSLLIDAQGLERRDVEYAAARALGGRRRKHGAMEAPEKCSECFAASRRGEQQSRFAT